MTNYYVATTGNDGAAGTSLGTAWLTLQHAAATIAGGDTVWVADGTYTVTSIISITTGGTSDASRTILRSTNLHGAKIVNNITPTNGQLTDEAILVNANYVDVIGFDISGANGRIGIYAYGDNSGGSGTPVGNHIRIQKCFIHDLGQSVGNGWNCFGIDMGQHDVEGTPRSSYSEITGCSINNIGQTDNPGCHPIYANSDHITMSNNIVSNCAGFGINNFHYPHHNIISNNLVFKCGTNNTAPHQGGGIYFSSSSTGVAEICDFNVCTNNIIRDCVGYAGIYEEVAGENANNTYSNNSFFGNGGATNGNVLLQSGASNANPVTTDPLLVNYQTDGSGDYHLTVSSPCIGAGTSVGMPSFDYDGKARSGSHPAIGPYTLTNYASFSAFMSHL